MGLTPHARPRVNPLTLPHPAPSFKHAGAFSQVVQVFPMPILGVLLLFEGLAMALLIRDTSGSRGDFSIALAVGFMAFALPYGYVVALVVGRNDVGVGFIAPQVATASQQRAPAGSLALTGADIAELALLGAIAVGTGAIVVRRGRPVQS